MLLAVGIYFLCMHAISQDAPLIFCCDFAPCVALGVVCAL
ncbi:hypothetical protein HBZS_101040 [Helicobacter bizzozeronii CCUG 35545]|nr:hypothetical protein HBZS_101040 [Helicobacter bizzozeronii CCUG 35545]